jgi:hypothetical protein
VAGYGIFSINYLTDKISDNRIFIVSGSFREYIKTVASYGIFSINYLTDKIL